MGSGNSMARAIVTPSLMTFGEPNSSSTTLRPVHGNSNQPFQPNHELGSDANNSFEQFKASL
jgi:hypothetical protein